jgi:hypothetical protein
MKVKYNCYCLQESNQNTSKNDIVILDNKFRRFLKMRQTEIQYNVILNYLLCNYFDDIYENDKIITHILRSNFKNFLINERLYYGDDYSREGVKYLLNKLVSKKTIFITI